MPAPRCVVSDFRMPGMSSIPRESAPAALDRRTGGRSSTSSFATIRARLYVAFGFAAAMTVVGSLFALYAFTTIKATIVQIVSVSMPATVESLRLSEETSGLVATAPRLVTAADEFRRYDVASDIAARARKIEARIERLRQLDAGGGEEIAGAKAALLTRLDALDRAVTDRLSVSGQRRAAALSIQRARGDFLEEIDPAIEDADLELMTAEGSSEASVEALRRLLELQAQANLLAGLLTESSLATDDTPLGPLRDLVAAAQFKIAVNLKALANPALRESLTGLYGRLAALADRDGIIDLRARELQREHETEVAFAATQAQAAKLKGAVDRLVSEQERSAQAVSGAAAEQIRSGQVLLSGLSAVALIAAGLIAWLYVGRNIARRLALLSEVMRRIAQGDRDVAIPVGGRDEIADMARTLVVFREATADVAAARRNETERACNAEARRELVEAATQNFEQAVSEIIGAFVGAARTMDKSAQAMAETAHLNQMQAVTTAAASEQATANVRNVASAAEEIAATVEHISAQVGESATIARAAAGEAQLITRAVESLADAVGQIGDISKLIRGIAAQTNLLALNATIEAARAGVAGRGFAVVAQEVKALAAETEKATEDITRQISSVQATTSQAVLVMKTITGTITRLDEIANAVAVAIAQQGAVSQEIAHSAIGAAEGTRDVATLVDHVSQAAVQAGDEAKAVLSASGELATRSDMLRGEVERFLVQVRVA
jgi:methyl-accepting chemotaxis protein